MTLLTRDRQIQIDVELSEDGNGAGIYFYLQGDNRHVWHHHVQLPNRQTDATFNPLSVALDFSAIRPADLDRFMKHDMG